jgi:ParB-like chromosome segregation protein Spo0J
LVAVKAVALAGLAVADALVRALAVEVTLLLLRAIEARGGESVAAIGRIQRVGVGRERLVAPYPWVASYLYGQRSYTARPALQAAEAPEALEEHEGTRVAKSVS